MKSPFSNRTAFAAHTSTSRRKKARGYLLIEALVYIGVLAALLGVAYCALFRCIDNSVALRHNSDQIAAALRAGEIWRADIRGARSPAIDSNTNSSSDWVIATARGQISYRFETNGIFRRRGGNPWQCVLHDVKWSSMRLEPRESVLSCRWELELLPYRRNHSNTNRVHPIFSFVAVPNGGNP
ncbi:MAG TPA: hypothetical protein VHH88_06375 [Verrucomicrobiae bacterium]|nr:hypothetical protein [Verrucomicrobiae bacterium]